MTDADMRGSPSRHAEADKVIEVVVTGDDIAVALIKSRGPVSPTITADKLAGALREAAGLLDK